MEIVSICLSFIPNSDWSSATHSCIRSLPIKLDYIITRKRDLQDMCTARVMPGAEFGSDHKLVCGKLKFHVMRKPRFQGVKFPKRIDVSKLQNFYVRKELQEASEN